MKKGFRKVAAYILALAMLFAYMPTLGATAVYADDGDLPALNVQFNPSTGLLTWEPMEQDDTYFYRFELIPNGNEANMNTNELTADGSYQYQVLADGTYAYDVDDILAQMEGWGWIEIGQSYTISLSAAEWVENTYVNRSQVWSSGDLTYNIPSGKIRNVSATDGWVNWSAYEGGDFDHYQISVENPQDSTKTFAEWADKTSDCFQLDRWIDTLILKSELTKSENGVYTITVSACDEDDVTLAESSVPYSYVSSAEPVEVGAITGLDWNQNTRVLSWDDYEDPNDNVVCDYAYTIQYDANHRDSWYVEETQADLVDALEELRESGKISKGDEITIYVTAYTRVDPDDPESDRIAIAQTEESNYIKYTYEPYELGAINVFINDGYLKWDEFTDAAAYNIDVNDHHANYFSSGDEQNWTVDSIESLVGMMIRSGELEWNEDGDYTVTVYVTAVDENDKALAKGSIDYTCHSDEEPVQSVEMTGFSVDENDILTWDPVEGAEVYYYNVTGTDAVGTEIDTYMDEYRVESESLDLMKVFLDLEDKYTYELEEGLRLKINVEARDWSGNVYGTGSWDTKYKVWNVGEMTPSIENGIMSWTPVDGAAYYTLTVDNCSKDYPADTSSVELNDTIDLWVQTENLFDNYAGASRHEITLEAKDAMGRTVAKYQDYYNYKSGATYGELTSQDISGITYDEETDMLSWNEVPGAFTYYFSIGGNDSEHFSEPSGSLIDLLKRISFLEDGEETTIEFYALNSNEQTIGTGTYDFTYHADPKFFSASVIEDDGSLYWKEVTGAETYKVVVGDPEYGYSEEFGYYDQPVDLTLLMDKASIMGYAAQPDDNVWQVTVYAMSEDPDGEGGEVLAEWTGKYEYEAKTVQPLTASIDNGQLYWDEIPGAERYYLYVIGPNSEWSTDNPTRVSWGGENVSFDLNGVIDSELREGNLENTGTFYIRLAAMDERDDELAIAEWEYNYKYKSDAVPLVRDIKNFRVADQALQWDAVEGAVTYKVTYWEPFAEAEPDDWEGPETVTLTEPSFDISSVLNGDPDETSYCQFIVYAYNEKGEKVGRGETGYRYPEGEAIQTIELTGITSSIAKGGPVIFSEEPAVDDESKMFIQSEKWTNIADEDDFFMGFEEADGTSVPTPGSTYRYSIQLSAEEGYHFTKDMTVTCNGKTYTADELKIELINCGMTVQISGLLDDTEIEATQISEDDVYVGYGYPGTEEYRDLAKRTYLYKDKESGEKNLAMYVGVFLKEDPSVMLEAGTDYTIEYDLESPSQTAKITGIGEYTGTFTVPMSAAKLTVSVPVVKFQKSGSGDVSHGEKVTITRNGVETVLKYGKDYGVGYMMGASNIGEGYALAIWGRGDYVGWLEGYTYKVVGDFADTVNSTTAVTVSSATYTGKTITPKPVVKFTAFSETKTLKEGTDYTVTIKDSKGNTVTKPVNAGTYTITVKGKGNYTGTKSVKWTMKKASQKITAKAAAGSVAVGKATTISVSGNKGTKSFKSSDTTVATVDSTGKVTAKKVGTVTITATSAATTNYNAATAKVTVKVVPAATSSVTAANQATGIKVSWKKVTGATGYYIYRNGTKVKTITRGSTVSFADTKANTNGTKYTYKIVAYAKTGTSTLSKSASFYRVAKPSITSLKNAASKKMTVKWSKNAKASGYEIQYATNSSFKSAKTVKVTSKATVSKTISKLTKGKTYYVRVRTYKTLDGKKCYSVWSATKKVKIAK